MLSPFRKKHALQDLEKGYDVFKAWCREALSRGAAGTRGSSKESRRRTSDTSYYQRQKRSDGSNPPTASSLRSETLRKHWTNDDCGRGVDRLAAAFRQARTEALDSLAVHGSSMFTGKQVAGALRAMRPERVCGLDSWIPSDWPS